jgi:hypothetical protein
MCRPEAVVCCSTLAWRVGAPVPRVGRLTRGPQASRSFTAELWSEFTAEFTT